MSSSNPFRKKASDAASSSPVKSSLRIDPYPLGHESTSGRPKTVKKVRVLSPPPLSPDSPEWPVANATTAGPLTNGALDADIHIATTLARNNGAAFANPFSKSQQQAESSDREHLSRQRRNEGEALKAGNSGRQSLNVDSFRMLLMTGKSTGSDGHFDETVALAAQSAIGGQGETKEVEAELEHDQPVSKTTSNKHDAKDRKSLAVPLPPPPPSSRHGKSLRQDGSRNSKPGAFSDINKPLPPSPARRIVAEEIESPFDEEQVGGDSEDDIESPTTAASYFKKSAPLPPPRKSQAKTESHSQNGDGVDQASSRPQIAESLKTTSADEMVSQSEVSRPTTQAPAPPPPRRPHAVSKTSTRTSSQELPSYGKARAISAPGRQYEANSEETDLPAAVSTLSASGKLATPPRPPPPPARNSSVRRHRSSNSIDSVSRRASASAALAQPPPPPPPPPRPLPRPRGSSGSSVDVADPNKNMDTSKNAESGLAGAGSTESTVVTGALGESASDPSKAFDILADLDALQREVDALRGKLA
ncbi:hypothetical protein CDD81_7621 [Ophiocordyceps australis]|uniref:DZF domain-containing protein n=1 Tax=Ophiocordyceps australis TaxID=1399860 RepID=A0A2C5XXT4_9HYPO|nr:hypothetical protein CDD81_7621 [Ophiocordyceps australis]